MLVGTITGDSISPSLRRCFTHELPVEPPDADGREILLRHYLSLPDHSKSDITKEIVKVTNGFFPRVRFWAWSG